MSVHEGNRKMNRFMVTTKTNELYGYTSTILRNQENFPYEVDSDLINSIKRVARRIHVDAFRANEIKRVDTRAKKAKRLELQRRAISNCNELLALIDMTRTVFHTPHKRRAYWGKKVIEARGLIERWNESDAKRYKHL